MASRVEWPCSAPNCALDNLPGIWRNSGIMVACDGLARMADEVDGSAIVLGAQHVTFGLPQGYCFAVLEPLGRSPMRPRNLKEKNKRVSNRGAREVAGSVHLRTGALL
eukprot:7887370-Pyramimonas_sp.AAC.1